MCTYHVVTRAWQRPAGSQRAAGSQHLLVLLSSSGIGDALLAQALPLGVHTLHTQLGVSALGLQQRAALR